MVNQSLGHAGLGLPSELQKRDGASDNPVLITLGEPMPQRFWLNVAALDAGASFPSKGFAKLEHSDFMAKVPKVLKKAAAEFSATALIDGPNGSKRTVDIFNLPKDLTFTLVLGYDVKRRYAVTRRWLELEERPPAIYQQRTG